MTFADKAISLSLVILSLLAIFFQGLLISDTGARKINISVDGELYGSYEFSEEEQTVEIKTRFGENLVKINEKSVWVEDASCPDKLDVKAGKINKAGQMIVCLPNRLMIEILGNEKKVDKVTY